MSDVQLTVIDQQDTQLVLSASEDTQLVLSTPGILSTSLMMQDGSNSALALGSASTPSLKFAGDANTGIFSPGADQFSVTTGGTERLRIDSAGQIEAVSLGSAAAPTFSFTGDPNTGVYSPGADQLAISTAGTGRLFVDASGNVSLVQSPQTGGIYSKQLTVAGLNASMAFRANSTGVYADQGIFFAVDGTNYSQIYNDGIGQLIFRTGSGLSERLRITSAGLVGIGTSSPGLPLDVVGGIRSQSGTIDARLQAGYGGAVGIGAQSNDPVLFIQNATERFRIDTSGRLGIGTTAPSSTLTVNGTCRIQQASSFAGINIKNNNDSSLSTTTSYIDAINNLDTIDGHIFFEHLTTGGSNFAVGTTPAGDRATDRRVTRLIVTSAGLVGIGTSAPSAILDVRQNQAAYSYFDFYNITAGGGIVWRQIVRNLADTGTTSIDLVKYTSGGFAIANNDTGAANFTAFNVGASERLRITSTGNVGIGTTAPSSLLDISGGYPSVSNNSDDYRLRWRRTDGSFTGGIKVDGFHKLTFALPDTSGVTQDRVVIDSAGRIGIGTTSPGELLQVNGNILSNGGFIRSSVSSAAANASRGFRQTIDGTEYLAIYHDNSAALFEVNAAERMRITSAGRVGIGTTSPNGTLDVKAAASTAPLIIQGPSSEFARIDSSGRLLVGTSTSITGASIEANSASTVFRFANPAEVGLWRVNGSSGSPTVVADGNILGRLYAVGYDGTNYINAGRIEVAVDGTPGANDMPGRLVFSTTADGAASPTERMRITQNGSIRTFGAATTLQLSSATGAGTAEAFIWGRHTATTVDTGTTAFLVYTNGNVVNSNGSYTTLSDAKLKENIVDAGSQWDDLKAIQIRNWNFKAETGYETHRQIGPIAQELETVCPGLVFETFDSDEDGNKTGEVTKGVNQSVLYMKAVKALQEAMERIEQLEAKVAALEAQ